MPIQLLLIEDDSQIQESVKELLTAQGFQVTIATNGQEGINQAILHVPDLILCAVTMPEVDGYQVLKAIRTNRLTATVPFILLVSQTDFTDMRQGMNQGADDCLTKPFTHENLMHSIHSRLHREDLRKADLKTKLDKHRHALASVTAHEYNTALSGIIGFSSLLIADIQQFAEEDVVSMVTMIKISGLRLKRSLDNIQLMDMLLQVDVPHADFDYFSTDSALITTELVEDSILAVAYRQDRQIDCEFQIENARLRMSDKNLATCLGEIIDNAFKFSGPAQTIRLTGACDGENYCFSCTSKGQPFKAEYLDQIAPYKQFDRKQYEQQGFGLGLAIVKKILELNQSRLVIETPAEGETTIIIWIPQVTD